MSERNGGWEHERYCAAIAAEISHLAGVADRADLAAQVPACPGWTIARLLKHVGIAHRWAGHIVRNRITEPVRPRDIEIGLPDSEAEFVAWVAAGAAPLVEALRQAGPDAQVWTWGAGQNAHWWARRMCHETTVHRADAELALGRVPEVEPAAAADGIDEFLTILAPAIGERLREVRREGQTIHLHATSPPTGHAAGSPARPDAASPAEWLITLHDGRFRWKRQHGKATVAVRGQGGDLLLLTYGRLKPPDGRFEVFGDRLLLDDWLRLSAF